MKKFYYRHYCIAQDNPQYLQFIDLTDIAPREAEMFISEAEHVSTQCIKVRLIVIERKF